MPGCACSSVGEENLLMENDKRFPEESILVHEFGHAVMIVGLSNEDEDEANVSNPEEFWAEATQAWFSATARSDVNCDLRCGGDVHDRCDEGFVQLLESTYGNGEWRYVHAVGGETIVSDGLPAC